MGTIHLRAGPIVRRVLPDGATVWLLIDRPGTVTLSVYAGEQRVAVGSRGSVAVGPDAHVVAIEATPEPGAPLRWGAAYTYTLAVDDEALDLAGFCLPGQARPSFRLFASTHLGIRLLHGAWPAGRTLAGVLPLLLEQRPPQALFLAGGFAGPALAGERPHTYAEWVESFLRNLSVADETRVVLANVATWTTLGHREDRASALAAYAIFEHWGNAPHCFDGAVGRRFLAAPSDPAPLLDDPAWRWEWGFDTEVFTALAAGSEAPGPGARHPLGFTLLLSPGPVLGRQWIAAPRPPGESPPRLDSLAALGHVLLLSGEADVGFVARLADPGEDGWEVVNLAARAPLAPSSAASPAASGSAAPGTVRGAAGLEVLSEDEGVATAALPGGQRSTRFVAQDHLAEVWFEPGIVVQRYHLAVGAARPEHTARFQPAGAPATTLQSALSTLGRSGSAPRARQRAREVLVAEGAALAGLPPDTLSGVLRRLKALNCFPEMIGFIEAAAPARSPQVLLLLAQAYIEMHRCTKAIEVLRGIDPGDDRHLATERTGLLGRAYKQLWVDAAPNAAEPREADLLAARAAYAGIALAEAKDPEWLLVNQLAVESAVARRLPAYAPEAHTRAVALAEQLWARAVDEGNPWAQANRLEAALVLGKDPPTLRRFLTRYLSHRDITAFEARGTLRQLIQLHGLTRDTAPGSLLLPMLESAVLAKGGTGEFLDFTPARLRTVPAQGDNLPLVFLRGGLERARSVGRVEDASGPVGTGFMVDLSGVRADWGRVFVTNAHVVDRPGVPGRERSTFARAPEEVVVRFWGEDDVSRTSRVVWRWSSPVSRCDTTVLALVDPLDIPAVAVEGGEAFAGAGRAFMNVIGHPAGQDARISVQDNELADWNDDFLWYRAGTEPGSSGSPVFDNQWRLVGLHHARSDTRSLNEGIRMSRILKELRDARE